MAQPDTKNENKLTIEIRPGPASPAQKQAWTRFWSKVISQMKANGNHKTHHSRPTKTDRLKTDNKNIGNLQRKHTLVRDERVWDGR